MNKFKKYHLGFTLLLIALFSNQKVNSQSLNVNNRNGSNSSYALQDVRRLTFVNTSLVVLLHDGNSYSFPLSTLSNYRYNGTVSGVKELLSAANDWQLSAFPNPTSSEITIQFILKNDEEISYSISDLTGKVYFNKNLGTQSVGNHSYIITIQDLPQGNYLLRLNRKGNSFIKNIIKI